LILLLPITSGPTLSDIDKISLTADDNVKAGIKDSNQNWIGNTPDLTANTEGAIILSPLQNVANGIVAIDDIAGNLVESNTYVALGTNENDSITASNNGDIIMGFDGNDNITGGSGDDLIEGGNGDDTIDESAGGNNVIRGGAGVDTIIGGSGDDTFVVLGTIDADDYVADDVGQDTGAYQLGLTDLIDAGLDTSDSGTDGSDETYDGGDGNNVLEIWGNADITNATLHNINIVRSHSDITISATQLEQLFIDNNQPLDLELMNSNSKVTITELNSYMGLELLKYLTPDMSNLSNTDSPNAEIDFTLDADNIDDSAPYNIIDTTDYSIKYDDLLATHSDNTLTDGDGENSFIIADDKDDTINAGDGNDIIVMQTNLTKDDTIDGGDGTDILLFTDTSGSSDILDNVTNVEIISIKSANDTTAITTKDSLVASGKTLRVDTSEFEVGDTFIWDGSAETDGSFIIDGGSEDDIIIGGYGNDTIYGRSGDDYIDAGAGDD